MISENTNVIVRSQGTTVSERYLAQLADRTFLNLWSYPNLFRDKKEGGKGDGKELCDLLVVCGDHVLVFSDRTVAWPNVNDVNLAWRRWFKRAVKESADQILGAQRWLNKFPGRVFLDSQCTQQLPLSLPPNNRMKLHGIVVALGAGKACVEYFEEGIGSLMVSPNIKGGQHLSEHGVLPFVIGDINPSGAFIHVFDDATLDIVMTELDTVTDLTDYLTKKENLIRSTHLIGATGEEDLVAYYMTHVNASDEHDFSKPDNSAWSDNDAFVIGAGHYSTFLSNPQYIAKKMADKDSYIWDKLIEAFTNNMLAGTTVVQDNEKFDLTQYEEGVRHMALVPRFLRRVYGRGIIDALKMGSTVHRMTRAFLPGPTETNKETGFFFMTLAVPNLELPGGYEQYRQVRRNMLETYALFFLRKSPSLKRIIGIATEPPTKLGEVMGSSEDLILAEQPTWSEDIIKNLEERQTIFDVAREGNFREHAITGSEFPDVELKENQRAASTHLNRQQRRAQAKARSRKR